VSEIAGSAEVSQDEILLGDLEGGAVVDLVEGLMLRAVRMRASDIHVEPVRTRS